MASAFQSFSAETGSRLLSALAILSVSVAATVLLLPEPLADVFFTGWVLFGVALSLVGGVAAWTNRTPLVWVAALLLTGLSIVGMWSIGFLIAPAAVFLLGSAVLSQLAGPREDVRRRIIADPPTVPEAVLKALAGIGFAAAGGLLVYFGAFARELFTACVSETLACTIDNTHWDAVGMTLLGLIAVCVGCWMLWKQIYVARVLASESRPT